jgi:drug/metabolite transporter (DMT)-like permease
VRPLAASLPHAPETDPWAPLLAALASNLLLGVAIVATRYVIAHTEYLSLAFLRYSLAAATLAPFALWLRPGLPPGRDLLSLAALGVLLFGLFPLSYNAALQYTLATRAAVAFAGVPVLTLGLAALLGYEALTLRKALGAALALAGVALALGDRAALLAAPAGMWRGDLLMGVTVVLGSSYNVLSRRPLQRGTALGGTTISLVAGAAFLGLVLALRPAPALWPPPQPALWAAVAFVGIGGGSLGYFLFVWALKHTTPSRVAVFVPLNPIVAAVVASAWLGEPVGAGLVLGLAFVTAGIALVNWPAVQGLLAGRPGAS